MAALVEREYRCGDGTPFPVAFDHEADAEETWALDREHTPLPLTPMAEALTRLGDAGSRQAYDEVGMVRPPGFGPSPRANGFAYYREAGFSDDDLATMFSAGAALVERHGSAAGIWRDHCLPLVHDDCRALREAAGEAPLAELARRQAHCLQVTMIPAFVGGHDMQQLAALCDEVRPGDGALVAHELAQGYGNQTLDADRALWQLGEEARASADVSAALAADEPAAVVAALRAAGTAPSFFTALDAFLADYGERAEGWDIGFPAWSELGDGFWNQLCQAARPGTPDPADAVAKAAARRTARVAEMEDALAGDEERLARLRRRIRRTAPYVAVREERAHWQLVSVGLLRGAVLRRGAALVGAGALDAAGDALYLLPDELEEPDHSAGLRDRVAERRAAHGRWLAVTPPPVIGGAGGESGRVTADEGGAQAGPVLRGTGASRGCATGRARVIVDLADADRLQPGEVLVCTMTSPPWTPLFGVAAAVVADSGDIASHVAVAAREYGIPCVVATKRATTAVPDGATVTVDGAAGTVRIGG